jgi:hypothetical protein
MSFIVWLAGFFSNTITWRGLVYRVQKGQLFPIPDELLAKKTVAEGAGASVAGPGNIS